MTLPQVATAANISIRQLHRMRARGTGPRVTMWDGCLRVSPNSFQEWAAQHTQIAVDELPPIYRRVN